MNGSTPLGSDDKLLLAAIDLIADKGYNGVSTKEIAAAAGLSEKTLFRRFGTKRHLLESAFDRYHYGEEMKKLFAERLVGDLRQDLRLISRTYHDLMNRNRKMIMISIKDEGHLPGFQEMTRKHPQQFMEGLTEYFRTMTGKGKAVVPNPELQAAAFLMMQFGAFMNNLENGGAFAGITLEGFIEESVEIFARGGAL
ncbi:MULTISPECIES: TetR/AcrR family transcriptional regulator [Paenibacillus]|uniref:TetR/AcrR family transcriptional regulator n=1 Tax=Paenibacillus TaxID=44249 RepID=UPI0022B92A67|nr:TetR/AcrR family transcriptional regulator [Paenibacillus caseinilyticus]MCZ8520917.1 TetR/AcrR family transcriptional regulator [Paenibacillus caseinilyticus]